MSKCFVVTMLLLFAVGTAIFTAPAHAVSNDNFANAQTLAATGNINANNSGATRESGEPRHGGSSGGASIWYRWVAPSNGLAIFSTEGSDFDTVMGVYTGNAVTSLALVAGNDDTMDSLAAAVTFNAVAGRVYSIAIDGYGGGQGNIVLAWGSGGPVTNDNFADAIGLSGVSGTQLGSNIGASPENDEPISFTSIWYRWTARTSGQVVFDTAGSNFDSVLGVLTGNSLGNLNIIAYNDDFNNSLASRVSFEAIAGTTYMICVGGVGNAQGFVRLNWRSVLPVLDVNSVATTEGNSGTKNLTFTISLSYASALPVTVRYYTTNATAIAPDDYVDIPYTTLTFAPSQTVKSINVAVRGNSLNEANETFHLRLASPTNAAIGNVIGVGTIVNDDAAPTVSIDDVTIVEPAQTSTANATFAVGLSAPSGRPVTLRYATLGLTAQQTSDYAYGAGTMTFAPGETLKFVNVQVKGDLRDEADEKFRVYLSNFTNATPSKNFGDCTIMDDDALPTVSVNDIAVSEPAGTSLAYATFTVSLNQASGRLVTVRYGTADGTARQPADYIGASGTLVFSPGETRKAVHIVVAGDTADEANEAFAVQLLPPTNATVEDGTGTGRIIDNDSMPSLSISDATVTESSGGNPLAVALTVRLSAPSGYTVTVRATPVNGTAVRPGDYGYSPQTLQFLPGQTSQTIALAVFSDSIQEQPETFSITLSDATHATIARASATCTILDRPANTSATREAAIVSPSALVSSNSSLIILTFREPLVAASAADAGRYTVAVNGKPATVTSARYNSATREVTLSLQPASFKAGDEVRVSLAYIAAASGDVLSGEFGPFVAR